MSGKQNRVVISFGGNEHNSLDCFDKAIDIIEDKIGEVETKSDLYRTKAWGMKPDTPDFYNQVIFITTKLKAKKLLKKTQKIEKKLGRKEKSTHEGYKDRPIDIDLLFFNEDVISRPKLVIPHYLIHKRKFILEPLCELIPEYIHPVLKKTIKELLLSCSDELEVERIKK